MLWWEGTSQAKEWARLGIALGSGQSKPVMGPCVDEDTGLLAPGVQEADIPSLVASFMFHLIEARFWSYAETQHRWPGAFAGILSETNCGSAMHQARDFGRHAFSQRVPGTLYQVSLSSVSKCIGWTGQSANYLSACSVSATSELLHTGIHKDGR